MFKVQNRIRDSQFIYRCDQCKLRLLSFIRRLYAEGARLTVAI